MGAGRGRNPPNIRASGESGAGAGNEVMTRRPRTAPTPRLQQGKAMDYDSAGLHQQYSDGADHARAQKRHELEPRVQNTCAGEAGQGLSQCGTPGKWRRP